jgi:hypothetical protein
MYYIFDVTQTATAPKAALDALGEFAAEVQRIPTEDAQTDAQIRAVIACIGFGSLSELGEVPSFLRSALRGVPASDVSDALRRADALGTLCAASDLDPLDRGPAHLALSSAVSALVLAQMRGLSSRNVLEAVAVGSECGARLRRAVTTVRPGVGFHSAGTFGLFAAAATSARLLGLDAAATTEAIAIAFTRAAGLALNSAQTRIGLTHFGAAASHGIEAAMLAADGWTASHRLDIAYQTLFGVDGDLSGLGAPEFLTASRRPAYKHYACNVYVNIAIRALLRLGITDGPIEIVLPPVRHLDNAEPRDVRQLRNSAQGAVAAVALHGPSYRAFVAETLGIGSDPALARRLATITVRIDGARSTSLDDARVDVATATGSESARADELAPWVPADLARLRQGYEAETSGWAERLFDGDLIEIFAAALRSMEEETA